MRADQNPFFRLFAEKVRKISDFFQKFLRFSAFKDFFESFGTPLNPAVAFFDALSSFNAEPGSLEPDGVDAGD